MIYPKNVIPTLRNSVIYRALLTIIKNNILFYGQYANKKTGHLKRKHKNHSTSRANSRHNFLNCSIRLAHVVRYILPASVLIDRSVGQLVPDKNTIKLRLIEIVNYSAWTLFLCSEEPKCFVCVFSSSIRKGQEKLVGLPCLAQLGLTGANK